MGTIANKLKALLGPFTRRGRNGIVVYTQPDCSCTEAALELLREDGIEPDVRQLEHFPDVRREFGAATPIVEIDGRVRFFGRVDRVLLRRLLRRRAARR